MNYTIKAGDTLSKIAQSLLGSSTRWREIWNANPQIPDPNRIYVGQVIKIPEVYGPFPAPGFNPTPQVTPQVTPIGPAVTPTSSFDLNSLLSNQKLMIAAAGVGLLVIFLATGSKKSSQAVTP